MAKIMLLVTEIAEIQFVFFHKIAQRHYLGEAHNIFCGKFILDKQMPNCITITKLYKI